MKKHETLSRGEELLARVLDECLEEDLSFVPPEREIARKHRFSEKFEKTIGELLENTSNETRKKEIKKHFSPRYGQWAACILLFCICSGLFYYVIGPASDKGMSSSEKAETTAETAETAEAADGAAEETYDELAAGALESGGIPEEAEPESAWEEAEPEEDYSESENVSESAEKQAAGKIFCGQTIRLAEQQEVPESLEHVTTLVNCPVQDEENPVLILTIGNTGEENVQYLDRYDLEVWIDDGWYVIPSRSEEEGQLLTLEAGMAVDAEIDLTEYQIDYNAQQYRLIVYVDQNPVSAEFTFEEVFTETMEKLEEE